MHIVPEAPASFSLRSFARTLFPGFPVPFQRVRKQPEILRLRKEFRLYAPVSGGSSTISNQYFSSVCRMSTSASKVTGLMM